MGSRGASSGIAKNGKQYGTEYNEVFQATNSKSILSGQKKMAVVKYPTTQAGKDKLVCLISQSNIGWTTKRSAMPSGTDAKLMSLIDQGTKAYMTLPSGYSRTTNTTKPPTGWYWASSQPNGYGTKVLVKERKK